ncbi:MAG: helix-turn-helix domain-containing protein, partial [Oscillospiraceae bacterium]|nr:helix-turn-helix domain-containing protein [Oscillospiraceae bacterium]
VVPSPRVSSERHRDVVKILRYMQENYRTVTMSELSEHFNYSERQLQRIIYEASGLSFRDAIQTQKLTRAAELLRTTDLTVQLVAEQTGFQAVNNFRKLFSRLYQLTPAAYREKHQTGDAISVETPSSILP